jgi:hypothetical protein
MIFSAIVAQLQGGCHRPASTHAALTSAEKLLFLKNSFHPEIIPPERHVS